jgi:SAM-dependent methyltransferase
MRHCAVPNEASTQQWSGPRCALSCRDCRGVECSTSDAASVITAVGCGSGGAAEVLGVDLSKRMLERARAMTSDSAIEYRCCAIEDLTLARSSFDLVTSSLALHYVSDFGTVCSHVADWLVGSGDFVFSVEHPIMTALESQSWCLDEKGGRRHWPIDQYRREGVRHTRWFVDNVVKYHRTVETYVNTLIDNGLAVRRLSEPEPTADASRERPEVVDETRRPPFLLIAARKTAGGFYEKTQPNEIGDNRRTKSSGLVDAFATSRVANGSPAATIAQLHDCITRNRSTAISIRWPKRCVNISFGSDGKPLALDREPLKRCS